MSKTMDERWAALEASGKARWMPGMLTNHGARNVGEDSWYVVSTGGVIHSDPDDGEAPDWTDPATLGCLLAQVREAYGDDEIGLMSDSFYGETDGKLDRSKRVKWWRLVSSSRHVIVTISDGASGAHACLSALEARA